MRLILALLFLTISTGAQGIGGKAGIGGSAGIGGGSATGATFVNTTSCSGAASGTTCTASSLSIPSGDIIVVGMGGSLGATSTVSDSNSDTPGCGAQINEATGATAIQLCVMKAGATITTVTCTQEFTSYSLVCLVSWYTPGSLLGIFDQGAGADITSGTTWTTGTTGTLTGSNDLVVGMWGSYNTTVTSTYSDGGTQRIAVTNSNSTKNQAVIEDRNVSGTSGVAASGTFSQSGVGIAVAVMAVR